MAKAKVEPCAFCIAPRVAAAYFQYYMLDVMLEIASMKTVTVFV